jgi:hypothetical protein
MKVKNVSMLFIHGMFSALASVHAAELQPATNAAWEEYVRTAEQRMHARLSHPKEFLWLDEAPGRRLRAREGATLVAPMTGTGMESVPHGLIHHWIGAAFIPNVTLAGALRVLNDYDNYQQYYKPPVIESKAHARSDDRQEFSMRSIHRTAMATAVFETQYVAYDFPVDATHAYSVTYSTRVQEIENLGRPGERMLPPGRGKGYVWRLATISRFEQADGGVYIETETVALSRDIPASLRWMVSSFVARLSVDQMTNSLRQTRDAIGAVANKPMVTASKRNPQRLAQLGRQ